MINAFLRGFAEGRARALDKKITKALNKQIGTYIVVEAVGQRERDDLLARGWEPVLQDVSERGQWVKIYLMRRPRALALIA